MTARTEITTITRRTSIRLKPRSLCCDGLERSIGQIINKPLEHCHLPTLIVRDDHSPQNQIANFLRLNDSPVFLQVKSSTLTRLLEGQTPVLARMLLTFVFDLT